MNLELSVAEGALFAGMWVATAFLHGFLGAAGRDIGAWLSRRLRA